MTTDLAALATPPETVTPTGRGESPGFDERWAAWLAKGAAHERAFRRKMAFAAPILLLIAAILLYAFLGR